MPQTCKEFNCNNNIFGGGYCSYHQFKRHMRGGDKYNSKPRPKPKPIKKESKKRTEDKKYYSQHCKELTQELRDANNGKVYCFFTGKEIRGRVTYHHLLGRTGDFYLDKALLVPGDNDRHLEYHRLTVEQLLKTDWYDGFCARLKEKSTKAYDKEIKKQEKALFDLENDIF